MGGRLPVDGKKVIEHRITLGTKERQMIESYVNSANFNQIVTPTVAALSDVSFVVLVGGFLASLGLIEEGYWTSTKQALAEGKEDAASLLGKIGDGIDWTSKNARDLGGRGRGIIERFIEQVSLGRIDFD